MLQAFLPELAALADEDWQTRLARTEQMPPELELRLAALLHPLAGVREILQRLKFPNRTADTVSLWLSRVDTVTSKVALSDEAVRRLTADVGPQNIGPLLELAQAGEPLRAQVSAVLAQSTPLDPRQLALNGQDVMRVLGIGPSKQVGEATRFLFDQVLRDPALNTAEALTQLLRNWRP
jgi:tRNA nucleotidyltransferase (CCA-adding enzyme)